MKKWLMSSRFDWFMLGMVAGALWVALLSWTVVK